MIGLIEERKAESMFCPLLKDGCKGSGCAMWRWKGAPRHITWAENSITPTPKDNWVLLEKLETPNGRKAGRFMEPPEYGYCGLAGKVK